MKPFPTSRWRPKWASLRWRTARPSLSRWSCGTPTRSRREAPGNTCPGPGDDPQKQRLGDEERRGRLVKGVGHLQKTGSLGRMVFQIFQGHETVRKIWVRTLVPRPSCAWSTSQTRVRALSSRTPWWVEQCLRSTSQPW